MQAVSALCTPSLLPLNPGPVSCCQVRCHRRPRCKPGALRDMKGVSGRSAGRSQECPLLPPPVALECPASPPFPGTPGPSLVALVVTFLNIFVLAGHSECTKRVFWRHLGFGDLEEGGSERGPKRRGGRGEGVKGLGLQGGVKG